MPKRKRLRPPLGVDTGGTFTDLALVSPRGELRVAKLPSTPADPGRAVIEGLAGLAGADQAEIIHGTTVALNALLTGRIAKTALVTNEGFCDLIEIGRQDRSDIYDLHPRKPSPLVPRELRFTIAQRSAPEGRELVELARPGHEELTRLKRSIGRSDAESIAVCLLHSYADPAIEERVAEALTPLGLPITCSAGILPAYREVERFSTAIANAALVPILSSYLQRLGREFDTGRLSLLQNSGGTLPAERAAREPVRVLFSGPAGGVVGAAHAAREAGLGSIVTLDMGGTSTDVAFHDPAAGLSDAVHDAHVAGHPIAVPSLDIHTIGCGGGSRVHVDRAGVLHVGPDSAGADPGPVCYGRGEQLTVTDACLYLGYIAAEGFLGGELALDAAAVARAFQQLGRKLGTDPLRAAEGVLTIARAAMRRALAVRTMQRGLDPGLLPLVAFGGGGGLHAAALARALGMRGALIPSNPGVLSAVGMARADASCDRERTLLEPLSEVSAARRRSILGELAREAREELRSAGLSRAAITIETSLDLRYHGQSYELSLAAEGDPARAFHALHAKRYGWALEDGSIELVALRLRAIGRRAEPQPDDSRARPARRPAPLAARCGTREAVFEGRRTSCPVLDRSKLRPGHRIAGPAIVEEYSGTSLIPPGSEGEVRAGGHLWIRCSNP